MADRSALRSEIEKIAQKSQKALKTAKNNLEDGDAEAACSRAYYAVFHILQGILLTEELTYSKHSGVISGFSKTFIKKGVFPKDFSKKIRRLMRDREIGDYSYSLSIAADAADEDIEIAKEIVASVEAYLRDHEWLG